MKRPFLSLLVLSATISANAQLAPQTDAPLYRHMVEVNAQWKTMDPSLASDRRPVHFTNEAERIAMHLHLVDGYLRTHTPQGLSTTAAAERGQLLNYLGNYADRGLFPQNHLLPYRNPVFIDPQGTACAVGQLIIESGHRDLAEGISHEMNLAYLHDMHRTDVDQWATSHGFAEDELAWIQPSYPPTTVWNALGGGTNGTVNVLLRTDAGNLVVAGVFTQAGGVMVNNVALWDGSAFSALGAGVTGTITCGAVIGNDIYLGGSSLGGNNDLAQWNGTQWAYSSVFSGNFPQIFALHVHNGNLYAAGATQGFVGTDKYVREFNGGLWQTVGNNFNGYVTALGSHDSYIVAAGYFTATTGVSSISAMHVAEFGSSGWTQVGDGLDAPVHALLDVNGTLFAGGDMFNGSTSTFGMASIDDGAASWDGLMPGLASYITENTAVTEVRALTTDGGYVYIGGGFTLTQMTVFGSNVARFEGTADSFTPMADLDAPVDALMNDVNGLIAGGSYSQNSGTQLPFLAQTQISTGISGTVLTQGVTLFPNPATTELTITLDQNIPANSTVEVVDVQGRSMIKRNLIQELTTLDVSQLIPGNYIVRTMMDGVARTSSFVKR